MCKKYTRKENVKKDIYIDYDGVVRQTMSIAYEMMRNEHIDLKDRPKVISFFERLDWY